MTVNANLISTFKPRKLLNFLFTAGVMMIFIQLVKIYGFKDQNIVTVVRYMALPNEVYKPAVGDALDKVQQELGDSMVERLFEQTTISYLELKVKSAPMKPTSEINPELKAKVELTKPAPKVRSVELLEPTAQDKTPSNNGPIKVLFLTYGRGGSSFLGELVNRHPDGFYYFEPLFGVYSHLYGLPYGMDQERLFTYKNGSKERFPTDYEAAYVARNLYDLFHCNMDRLPVEVLLPPFKFAEELKRSNFIKCLLFKSVDKRKIHNKRRKWVPITRPHRCKSYIAKQCQGAFDENVEYSCFKNIFGKAHPKVSMKINKLYLDIANKKYQQYYIDKASPVNVDYRQFRRIQNFSSHNYCLRNIKARTDKCFNALELPCKKSTIIGAKVIRMRMENVANLLALDPSIKIIHYLRDPRGMLLSRFRDRTRPEKLMKSASKDLCKKMLQDVKARIELEKLYSKNFMVLKYEDLASDPMSSLENVYNFLNTDIPPALRNWLYNSTHFVKPANITRHDRKKLNLMGTTRVNATKTAYKWRDQIKQSTIEYVTNMCKEFLNVMNYSL